MTQYWLSFLYEVGLMIQLADERTLCELSALIDQSIRFERKRKDREKQKDMDTGG